MTGNEFSGRHVLVTGAGSGIGAAIARSFAAGGARVSLAGRRRAPLEAVATALPAGASLVLADFDVTNADAIAEGFASRVKNLGLSIFWSTMPAMRRARLSTRSMKQCGRIRSASISPASFS